MDPYTLLGLLAVVFLVLANGFFVATEFAIVAVRRSRVEQLARDGHPGARIAQHIVSHLDTYIAACQFGITLSSLALGWLGEPALAHLLEPGLEALLGRLAPAAAHGVAVGAAFAVITALHIVAGELAPKGLALQRPEQTALWVARPMQLFHLVFRWPIAALNAVGNRALRIAGLRAAAGHEMVHTAEELGLLVSESRQAGTIEESEARIARRAFQFADLTAARLMTPRTELDAVPIGVDRPGLLARVAATQRARLLVYDGSLDNIVGVLRVRDLVPFAPTGPERFDLRPLIRPVLIVPEGRRADDLLEDLQREGRHLAVVVDEYGGTAGIVTLADLMRALVGPIDERPGPGGAGAARVEPDGSVLLDGLTRIHELEELIGADVEEPARGDVDTLSGLVMTRLDRMPQVGDEVEVLGRRVRVERLQGRRVGQVRLLPATPR
jgi:CBS domain containing-hemolysin-like protein